MVPKAKGEILGVVIVESGWGSMLPTIVLANLLPTGPAARCGQLNIGDQVRAAEFYFFPPIQLLVSLPFVLISWSVVLHFPFLPLGHCYQWHILGWPSSVDLPNLYQGMYSVFPSWAFALKYGRIALGEFIFEFRSIWGQSVHSTSMNLNTFEHTKLGSPVEMC